MTARREVAVAVWAGSFASQQLAFAHLLDTAEAAGLDLPLDRVEAVPRDARRRLEHILGPEAFGCEDDRALDRLDACLERYPGRVVRETETTLAFLDTQLRSGTEI